MAESAAVEETRVAEAVARLLARQSSLLARATDDAAAASATRLGLSWLTDLMRSFDLHGAADWFQALRAKGEEHGATAAWPALGAPLCETLSGEVSRSGSLSPLGAEAGDWAAHVAEVGAFEEPVAGEAHDPGPPQTPEIEPEPQPQPAIEPGPVPPPVEEPPAPTAPEIEPPREDPPDPHAALFEAIADLAGDDTPAIDAEHGRIEITGRRGLPTSADSRLLIEALDRAAQAAGAVLVANAEAGALTWIVRLPRPHARHYLFAELAGAPVAVPWSRVIESDPASSLLVLGSGLDRIELSVDRLIGEGEGRPVRAPADAAQVDAPASFAALGWVRDAAGRAARVLDLALGFEPSLEPAAETGPALEAAAAPPEPVQPEPIPADTFSRNPEPAPPARTSVRALVADDSMMARVFLGRLLAQRGVVVEEAEDGAAARALLARGGFDLVFLDAEMPGAGALEILRDADDDVVARACVLVKDDEERRLTESFGGLPILYKPFAEDEVRSVVDTLRARTVPGS